MKIDWVPKKSINKQRVDELISISVSKNQFTNNGPNVRQLEVLIRDTLRINNDKAVICVNNGSAAIHALISAINMYHDKEHYWSTQSFTFPSSAQGMLKNVEIVDIDSDCGPDISQCHSNIDGIIVTNIFGNVVEINKYVDWCKSNTKILLFDNAATPFTFYNDQNSLNFGTGGIISFHHTKPIGFGEGGAIIVDKMYEYSVRRCINFGINNDTGARWNVWGSNYKMSDISAAYIIQYFEGFEDIMTHHTKLYVYMKNHLPENIKLFPNKSVQSPFLACFTLVSSLFSSSSTLNKLIDAGIHCRKYYRPLIDTPRATELYNNLICVPCTVDMTVNDIQLIIDIIKEM
jgi:dTDP-4-amino-4,6-dideoxygalactose transaminase